MQETPTPALVMAKKHCHQPGSNVRMLEAHCVACWSSCRNARCAAELKWSGRELDTLDAQPVAAAGTTAHPNCTTVHITISTDWPNQKKPTFSYSTCTAQLDETKEDPCCLLFQFFDTSVLISLLNVQVQRLQPACLHSHKANANAIPPPRLTGPCCSAAINLLSNIARCALHFKTLLLHVTAHRCLHKPQHK